MKVLTKQVLHRNARALVNQILCYIYYLQHERGRVVLADTNSSGNSLKNSSSYELTGEKSLEIDEVYAEKIKVLNFAHELLMRFLTHLYCKIYWSTKHLVNSFLLFYLP